MVQLGWVRSGGSGGGDVGEATTMDVALTLCVKASKRLRANWGRGGSPAGIQDSERSFHTTCLRAFSLRVPISRLLLPEVGLRLNPLPGSMVCRGCATCRKGARQSEIQNDQLEVLCPPVFVCLLLVSCMVSWDRPVCERFTKPSLPSCPLLR